MCINVCMFRPILLSTTQFEYHWSSFEILLSKVKDNLGLANDCKCSPRPTERHHICKVLCEAPKWRSVGDKKKCQSRGVRNNACIFSETSSRMSYSSVRRGVLGRLRRAHTHMTDLINFWSLAKVQLSSTVTHSISVSGPVACLKRFTTASSTPEIAVSSDPPIS